MKSLSLADKKRYFAFKEFVLHNIGRVRTIGSALKTIKEERLYLEEYETWEGFCEAIHDLTPRHANRLIDAVEVLETLNPLVENKKSGPIGPISENSLTESQLRELKKVSPEKRATVLEIAGSTGKPVTAKTIATSAAAVAKKSEPAVVRDALGCAIPDCCLPLWNRAQEVQDLMTTVSRVKGAIEKAHTEDDPMYRIVPQAVLDHLSRTYQFLTDAKPYAVCVFCQGKNNRESCRPCRGTGLISKYGYEVRADKKLVALREMAIKKEQEENATA